MKSISQLARSIQGHYLSRRLDAFDPALRGLPLPDQIKRYLAVASAAFRLNLEAHEQICEASGRPPVPEPKPPRLLQRVLRYQNTQSKGYYLAHMHVLAGENAELWADRNRVKQQLAEQAEYSDAFLDWLDAGTNAIQQIETIQQMGTQLN